MSNTDSSQLSHDAWYSFPGEENDVVLSTRVRLARNLADFTFPSQFTADEAERIQSLIFDSFANMENPDNFQTIRLSNIDALGQRILAERGMFPYPAYSFPWCGGIVRNDGKIACSINYLDHIRIASFISGFDCEKAYLTAHDIDSVLQDKLQFAASPQMGYLTSNLKDLGSGMKLSAVLHLPSITIAKIADKVFRETADTNCTVSVFFDSKDSPSSASGSFFLIQNKNSYCGDEGEQLQNFQKTILHIAEYERGATMSLMETRPTRVKDSVYRAIATLRYARLISRKEGLELISRIKWGINLGILSGIEHNELTALLYRIQNAHLLYVSRNGNLDFEKDIITEDAKIDRLRSLVMQEALSSVQIN